MHRQCQSADKRLIQVLAQIGMQLPVLPQIHQVDIQGIGRLSRYHQIRDIGAPLLVWRLKSHLDLGPYLIDLGH